ncbi:MAG: hypothetical protein CMO03_03225 [Thalassospira sp.]|jgi:hypothetical protein|nr:hypothetical protein [Thalassospira sp.]OHZ00656.1 hypothetical protein BC440_07260 [Thalassospira sp. MIT1004]MAL28522.1 hypothetical protein [Thalassospira sp.]MBA05105.1 hypothetical protein [Thalassospira sp.]HBN50227.1 hypothetical protein [Thalassospira sp.]
MPVFRLLSLRQRIYSIYQQFYKTRAQDAKVTGETMHGSDWKNDICRKSGGCDMFHRVMISGAIDEMVENAGISLTWHRCWSNKGAPIAGHLGA